MKLLRYLASKKGILILQQRHAQTPFGVALSLALSKSLLKKLPFAALSNFQQKPRRLLIANKTDKFVSVKKNFFTLRKMAIKRSQNSIHFIY